MFLGHFSFGLAAKAFAPGTSLGSLFLASQLLDFIWSTLLILGVERVRIVPGATETTPLNFDYYPFSHSLLLAVIWGLVVALVYLLFRRSPRGAVVMGGVVVSHWFLDLLVHQSDLPLYPGGALFGMGLWSSKSGTVVVEILLFLVSLGIYFNATETMDDHGDWRIGCLLLVLLGIYIRDLSGPLPSSVSAVAWTVEAQWLLVLWGYWADRHRVSVTHA